MPSGKPLWCLFVDNALPVLLSVASLMVVSRATAAVGRTAAEEPPSLQGLDAFEAVRLGNQQLLEGKPEEALEAYAQAGQLKPEAEEIGFVQGLGHYALKQFDQAREAFRRAEASNKRWLVNDAVYSLGTCDHAEALDNNEDLPAAISQLESAMQRYHRVLADNPDHATARTANYKAAARWRQLKEQLEQQQKEQEQSDQENQKPNQQEDSEQTKADQPQDEDEQGDPQQNQQQQTSPQEEPEHESQEAQAKLQEQTSREQAQRRLREMMEALLERQKMRPEQVQVIPVRPVQKDW